MAPQLRTRYFPLWIATAVLVGVAVGGGSIYRYEQTSAHVTVTGANWEVFVNNSSTGYVFNEPLSGCAVGCPTGALAGSVWTVLLPFGYGSGENGASILQFTAPSPFVLLSYSPALPIHLPLPGGAEVQEKMLIELPTTAGSYSYLGTIWIGE
ncbi:MAG: hypothetical protein L3K23_07695 [Thermoplasmata archaeon]|nr:hypothetical protein [Thermoplasmata archaeon]